MIKVPHRFENVYNFVKWPALVPLEKAREVMLV